MDRWLAKAGHRDGHFQLESGLHASRWFALDTLFCDPGAIAAAVDRLAAALAPSAPDAICGPLTGGAFLAQAVAARMGRRFLFTRRVEAPTRGLFETRYALPEAQRALATDRVAIVDDMISAGSAARATCRAIEDAGGQVVVVGALFVAGTAGRDHFDRIDMPMVAVESFAFDAWHPDACPLCVRGEPFTPMKD